MKQIISFKMISVTALLALAVGCATTTATQDTESMLVAAGFKVVTPKTAEQQREAQKASARPSGPDHQRRENLLRFPGRS